jgi:hypothetical protein
MTDPMWAYVDAVAARLTADGCEVRAENWSGSPVIVGHRADFKLQWMATRLHLVTIVASSPHVTQPTLEAFTNSAWEYALSRKGDFRGLQTGVAVLPALVTPTADPAALRWADEQQRVRFATMARPTVVDLSRNYVAAFRGSAMLGRIYAGHLCTKLKLYFPPPAHAGQQH